MASARLVTCNIDMHKLTKLLSLLLALAAFSAQPAERDTRKDRDRKSESAREQESYRDRYQSVERLPSEFRKSFLFRDEGRDPSTGEERGQTLRKHVAERATVEGIREQLAVQERAESLAQKSASPYRSMYVDLQTAERSISRAIKENQAIVDAWRQEESRDGLVIRHEHPGDIGVVMLGNVELRDVRDARLLPSRTSVVEFAKDGAGRSFIARSYPGIDGRTIEALSRAPADAAYAESVAARDRQQAVPREELRQEALERQETSSNEAAGSAREIRNSPGMAVAGERVIQVDGRWLRGSQGSIGLFPRQVAQRMEGLEFKTFDAFRRKFWRSVADTPELAAEFKAEDIDRMKRGAAPKAPEEQHVGRQDFYMLHHKTPINQGGGVYDMSNIIVVTPRYHAEILERQFHYGK